MRPLSPKAFRLLEVLTERRPQAVAQAELRRVLWPETVSGGTTLARLVTEVRAALGDHQWPAQFVRTLHRYGYAFCSEAVEESASERAPVCEYTLQLGLRHVPLRAGEMTRRDRGHVPVGSRSGYRRRGDCRLRVTSHPRQRHQVLDSRRDGRHGRPVADVGRRVVRADDVDDLKHRHRNHHRRQASDRLLQPSDDIPDPRRHHVLRPRRRPAFGHRYGNMVVRRGSSRDDPRSGAPPPEPSPTRAPRPGRGCHTGPPVVVLRSPTTSTVPTGQSAPTTSRSTAPPSQSSPTRSPHPMPGRTTPRPSPHPGRRTCTPRPPSGRQARRSGSGHGSPSALTETGYIWRYNGSDSTLFVVSAGSFSSIGSAYSATLSAGDVLRLEVQGTAIRGYVNGVLRSSATNGTVTTGDRGSLRIGGTAARLDDFSIGSLAGGGTFSFSGAAVGSTPALTIPDGTSAGTWTFAGTASGTTSKTGTATGTLAWSGTAAGANARWGSAAGSWGYTGTATGSSPTRGTATGSWIFSGTAAGETDYAGAAQGPGPSPEPRRAPT